MADTNFTSVDTSEGYKVNGTTVINSSGAIIGDIQATAASIGSAELAETTIQYAEVSISAADIVATGAGKLGHANGYPLVAGQTGKIIELESALLIFDYATAQYADGGNITVNISGGGAALTGVVSAANSLGAAADKVVLFVPLSTAGIAMTSGAGLNLVAAAAFTNPGTAAGVVRMKIAYRVHTTGL